MEKNTEKFKKLGELTGDKSTLFITLCAKAKDYRSDRSILHDEKAAEIVDRINADLSLFQGKADVATVIRTKHYDDWTKEFIQKHENPLIVQLGCGLDSRYERINPPSSVIWVDIDFPDVISYRKRFYTEKQGEYHMYGKSITNSRWFPEIPFERPTLIIAEGVFEYLDKEQVQRLLHQLTDYLHKGELIFDVISPFAMKISSKNLNKNMGAAHKWAVNSLKEVDAMNPDLERTFSMSLFQSPYFNRLGFSKRLIFTTLSLLPPIKNMMRLLKYEFNDETA
ncbi:MAG: class I SAM-dependent methyltransferase [Candidatus Azobacteroides sp.]|nr:class I SAM-dependent methyltransferase [Candidatus Azobacteroides sp.]